MNKNFKKLIETYKEKLNHNPNFYGPGFSHLYVEELENFTENISEFELEKLLIENIDRIKRHGIDLYEDICLMVVDMSKCNSRIFNNILKEISIKNFDDIIKNKDLNEENIYSIIETGCFEKISRIKNYLTLEMKELIFELYNIEIQ